EGDLQLMTMREQSAPELKRRELDLVDVGRDTTTGHDVVEVVRAPVAHANRAGQTLVVSAFQRRPFLARCARMPMEEEQVNTDHSRASEALVDGPGRSSGSGLQLGGDELLRSWQPTSPNGAADGRLVAIQLRRVDMAVAGLECPSDRILGLSAICDLPNAQSEQRHLHTVRKRH